MLRSCLLGTALFLAVAARAALPLEGPADPEGLRRARELQQRLGGEVSLPMQGASQGEFLTSAAELGAAAATGQATPGARPADYNALYALLQHYRDDLLKLGLDQESLDSQLEALRRRALELEARLEDMKPKDGLKIHGRVVSFFDDLHLTGPGVLGGPGLNKTAGEGMRYQQGMGRADLKLKVTRGPLEGHVLWSVLVPFALNIAEDSVREIYVELRTPVVLQVGDLQQRLSPLTLWRNQDENPFEPEPLRSRRRRHAEDLLLSENRWRLPGARLSTDLALGAARLELQAMAFYLGIPGQALNPGGTASASYRSAHSTYLSAWRAGLPLGKAFSLGYTGVLLWDVTESTRSTLKPFSSQVHSAEAGLKLGWLEASAEGAQSIYDNPNALTTGASTALALRAELALKGGWGKLRLSGRQAEEGFVSAAAQGRTEMPHLAWLGPFPTESTQVNSQGGYGIANLPLSPATRFNTRLLPPQTLDGGGSPSFDYLLPFDPRTNLISPYGDASPNRQGARVDASASLWGGFLQPILSADYAAEIKGLPVRDFFSLALTGERHKPMAFLMLRGGGAIDLKPGLGWPLRLTGGYTLGEAQNGDARYGLGSTLVDLGLEWEPSKGMLFSLGARHLDANGTIPYGGYDPLKLYLGGESLDDVFDIGAAGLSWQVLENTRLDLACSSLYYANKKNPAGNWQAGQGHLRITLDF